MEGTGRGAGVSQLNRLGRALSATGVPWLVTVFGMSGMTSPNGVMILPLLWFAPPFVLRQVFRAGELTDGRVRGLLRTAFVLGLATWVGAVAASLLGQEAAVRSAFWLGVEGGSLLYCSALWSLTRSMAWPNYALRWRRVTMVTLVALVGGFVASVIMVATSGSISVYVPHLPAWSTVLLLAGVVVSLVAMVMLASIHRRTCEAMIAAPAAVAVPHRSR